MKNDSVVKILKTIKDLIASGKSPDALSLYIDGVIDSIDIVGEATPRPLLGNDELNRLLKTPSTPESPFDPYKPDPNKLPLGGGIMYGTDTVKCCCQNSVPDVSYHGLDTMGVTNA